MRKRANPLTDAAQSRLGYAPLEAVSRPEDIMPSSVGSEAPERADGRSGGRPAKQIPPRPPGGSRSLRGTRGGSGARAGGGSRGPPATGSPPPARSATTDPPRPRRGTGTPGTPG